MPGVVWPTMPRSSNATVGSLDFDHDETAIAQRGRMNLTERGGEDLEVIGIT
jgi:hypothetical protein